MTFSIDPTDAALIKTVISVAEELQGARKRFFSVSLASDKLTHLKAAPESNSRLEALVGGLSDRELTLVYAVWSAGRKHLTSSDTPDVPVRPDREHWKADIRSTLVNSDVLAEYLKAGARLFGFL